MARIGYDDLSEAGRLELRVFELFGDSREQALEAVEQAVYERGQRHLLADEDARSAALYENVSRSFGGSPDAARAAGEEFSEELRQERQQEEEGRHLLEEGAATTARTGRRTLSRQELRDLVTVLEDEGLSSAEAIRRADRIASELRRGVPYQEAVQTVGGVRGLPLLQEQERSHDDEQSGGAISDRAAAILRENRRRQEQRADADLNDRIADIFDIRN